MNNDKKRLMYLLNLAKQWNDVDIASFDEITPDMDMLENRREFLDEAIELAQKIEKSIWLSLKLL